MLLSFFISLQLALGVVWASLFIFVVVVSSSISFGQLLPEIFNLASFFLHELKASSLSSNIRPSPVHISFFHSLLVQSVKFS